VPVASWWQEVALQMGTVSEVGDRPATELAIPVASTSPAYRASKRILDLSLSALGLAITSPLLLAIAAAVRIESTGPILFRQERVGLGGRPFVLYKFRSMHVRADQGAHRAHVSRLLRRTRVKGERTWVPIAEDQRVTRVGGFLRRSHLDELPQLINVVRGEMSLVGPRPPIPYEVELYEPWHLRRLSVLPGLTGLWQATAWGRLSFDEGVALDVEYVKRRSFWFDLQILARTAWQILTGRQF
jgi:lipopolysaccharide/colanic/teichoic acid biosynthesis glycosyltransferase